MDAARLLARGELTDQAQHDSDQAAEQSSLEEAAEALGLVLERPEEVKRPASPVFHLWPQNLEVWRLWCWCCRQWNHGFEGRYALDLRGCELVFDWRGVPKRKRGRIFELFYLMEGAALEAWAELREEEEARRRTRWKD